MSNTVSFNKSVSSKLYSVYENNTTVPPLVSTRWVDYNIDRIIPLQTALFANNSDPNLSFSKVHLKNAREFDIDEIADRSTDLPHMIPTEQEFEHHMKSLKISNKDHLVVYDTCFGHEKISIMNGGLPKWLIEKREVSTTEEREKIEKPLGASEYKTTTLEKDLICDYKDVLSVATNNCNDHYQLIDARPYLSNASIVFKSCSEIRSLITEKNIDINSKIISSCGSGITACIVYFGLIYGSNFEVDSPAPLPGSNHHKWKISVYDGSWAEYSIKEDSPIIKS